MKGLIFTYALTYGGAIASFINPFYGLLVYVCFAIIRPEFLWYWSLSSGGNFSRIIAIALLMGWAVHGFGKWNLGRSKSILFCLFGFWVWSLLSALVVASNKSVAFGFVEELAKILLPFVAGLTLIDSEKKLKQLAWVILLSQSYLAFEMNQTYLTAFNPLQTPWGTGGFGGMDNNCVAIAMVTGAGMAFFMGMHERGWRKWLAFGGAALMTHVVLFSFSRGGMVGLILMGSVSFWLIDKRPRHVALFGLAAIAGLIMAGPEVRDEFMSSFADAEQRDYSSQSRIDMWSDCLDAMQNHPVLGTGPNHWPVIAASYGWPPGKEAHTLWLQIGAELGIVGLGLLLGFYMTTAFRLYPYAKRKVAQASEWEVLVARMTIAALAGFMVSAQFVSLEGLELPYYIMLVSAGTLKVAGSQRRQSVQWVLVRRRWDGPMQTVRSPLSSS